MVGLLSAQKSATIMMFAPVAQWIERSPPEAEAQVRVLSGALFIYFKRSPEVDNIHTSGLHFEIHNLLFVEVPHRLLD